MKIKNLNNKLNLHIQKSYVEGIYSDNSHNRKLGRVGMSYRNVGDINLEDLESVEDNGDRWALDPKVILKRNKDKLSKEGLELLGKLLSDKSFRKGDIYEYEGNVYFAAPVEVDIDDSRINLGTRFEKSSKDEDLSSLYRSYWNMGNLDSLKEKYIHSTNESGTSYNGSSILIDLNYQLKSRENFVNNIKQQIYIDKTGADPFLLTSEELRELSQKYISDKEVEVYINLYESKENKEAYKDFTINLPLIKFLESKGVKFDKEGKFSYGEIHKEMEKYTSIIEDVIQNTSRVDFYKLLKECWSDGNSLMPELLKLRFAYKYNKVLIGGGWSDTFSNSKSGDRIFDAKKRNEILDLSSQLEYAVDDVLGDDKGLFIENPNIKFLEFGSNTSWGGAAYSRDSKKIKITDEYYKALKESRQFRRNIPLLSREKFMVEGFIHEIGHSIDIFSDIYNSEEYKDFSRHLGFDKNRNYTIFTNAVKNSKDSKVLVNQDYYLGIKKDKKKELIDKFKDLYEKAEEGKVEDLEEGKVVFDNSALAKVFISNYATKSASEGFAEYFSFYIGNKKVIDKAIKDYDKNPSKFLENADLQSWYKYSPYNERWQHFLNRNLGKDKTEEQKENSKKYYQKVVEHNIEMLKDMKDIIQIYKRKFSISTKLKAQ